MLVMIIKIILFHPASKSIHLLMKKTFIPLTVGGGLTNLDQIDECFKLGADKIVLNTSIKNNPNFINQCSKKYGAQAVSSELTSENLPMQKMIINLTIFPL